MIFLGPGMLYSKNSHCNFAQVLLASVLDGFGKALQALISYGHPQKGSPTHRNSLVILIRSNMVASVLLRVGGLGL